MQENYYKHQIYPFAVHAVENHIELHGYEKEIDLREIDTSTFAAILLAEKPDEMWDIVWSEKFYSSVIAAMRTEDTEDKIILAENIIDSIKEYFEPKMLNLLYDIHSDIKSEYYESCGKKFVKDDETGEGTWI